MHLPLSWDDPATREAIERYMAGVRADAPWCPWNIEFIRRINGLDDVDDVHRIVFDAEYLVLGLGDVYLGAPVATPLDPRHRLVTTKYNPARTWTPENAVGIGGAYLCIYGMEGPGGYQFVGRTVQVWSRYRRTAPSSRAPWLLRFFDRIRWYPVAPTSCSSCAPMAAGRLELDITDGTLHARRPPGVPRRRTPTSIDAFRATAGGGLRRRARRLGGGGRVRPAARAGTRPAAGPRAAVPDGGDAGEAPLSAQRLAGRRRGG